MPSLSTDELKIPGTCVSKGCVEGTAVVYQRADLYGIRREDIENVDGGSHTQIYGSIRETVSSQLQKLKEVVHHKNASELLDTQIAIVNDPEIQKTILEEWDSENCSFSEAVKKAFYRYIRFFESSENATYKDRAIDVKDVMERFIAASQKKEIVANLPENFILVTDELSTSDVITFYERGVSGIAMERGGVTSHSAILARSLEIPCIISKEPATMLIRNKANVILNATEGYILANPLKSKTIPGQANPKTMDSAIPSMADVRTLCGHRVFLTANIERQEEIPKLEKYKVEEIGLLRTEALILENEHLPTIEEQIIHYNRFLSATTGEVTIRMFDLGGDKLNINIDKEANPFLGWRGARVLLDEKELLRDQLVAILHVAAHFPGRISALVPMVTNVDELLEIRSELDAVHSRMGLDIPWNEMIRLGVMMEVPAAALMMEYFCPHADFFSIGTNDLTQYMLAVDRGNEYICSMYDQRHPVIWQLINRMQKISTQYQKPLVVCGELASDPLSALVLIGMGVTHLSMSPPALPEVAAKICSKTIEQAREIAQNVLRQKSLSEIIHLYKSI